EFTCTYCGARGHTKRSCKHRKADDAAVAEATASATGDANQQCNNGATAQSEIDLTQPKISQESDQ
ncbi:hypothetical protein PIB30_110023, partial [Stylosanthes scabra]|nr:hypothetical protein [Stylosanthes scabra]